MAEVRITPSSTKSSRKASGNGSDQGVRAGKAHVRKTGKDHGALPSWRQLESSENRRSKGGSSSNLFLERLSTKKFGLLLVVVAAAFTLYVGHVHSTDDLLSEVQRLRRENHQLHLKYNRLKGEYDRLTGPVEIRRRARALGFIDGGVPGRTVQVPPTTD
jgi:cell division protein FtsL